MPAALAAADIGVAPFDIGRARAAVARVLLVAAEDLRVHGGGPAGRRARGGSRFPHWSRTAAKDCSTIGVAGGRARRRAADADRSGLRKRLGAAARARARARLQLGRALRGARTPPSLEAQARRAKARGADPHPDRRVSAGLRRQRLEHLRAGPRPARARARRDRSSSHVPARRPACAKRTTTASACSSSARPRRSFPYVRNYYKSERLTRSLGGYLTMLLEQDRYDVVHAQHVMTTIAAIDAATGAGVPVVATVRDYWPVCYWSDLLLTREGLGLCPACTTANMRDLHPAARRRALAAGAADDSLHAREPRGQAHGTRARRRRDRRQPHDRGGPGGAGTRAVAVAHPGDPESGQRRGASRARDARGARCDGRGARREARRGNGDSGAVRAVSSASWRRTRARATWLTSIPHADLDWPLVVAGDGPDRAALEREATASGRRIEFRGWVDKDEAARLLAGASMLIFPSRGPESLSRVLIEASALGVPIAAMDTGGTRDIVEPDVTGLLSASPDGLAADVRRLRQDAALRRRLGDAAAIKVERDFDAAAVVARSRASLRGADAAHEGRAGRARRCFPLHGYGGLERHVYDLARALADRDVEVTLMTQPPTEGRRVVVPTRSIPPCGWSSCRTARSRCAGRRGHDGARSQHGVSTLRPARRTAGARSRPRRAGPTSSTGSARACSATPATGGAARRRRRWC